MKNRINISLSDQDLIISDIICNITGQNRSELISNLLMYKLYDLIDDDILKWEDVKLTIKQGIK